VRTQQKHVYAFTINSIKMAKHPHMYVPRVTSERDKNLLRVIRNMAGTQSDMKAMFDEDYPIQVSKAKQFADYRAKRANIRGHGKPKKAVHMRKGSTQAKAHMAHLRSMRRK